MPFRDLTVALLLAVALVACSNTIPAINARPAQYYEKKVVFRGCIERTQALDGETLLEVADAQAHRILVRTAEPLEAGVGTWVKVKGVLVAEARVGGKSIPDVVVAEHVSAVRAPWFPNLF